jgi:type VI secretion system protein ImpH
MTLVSAYIAQRAAEPWAYDYFALMRRLESLAQPAPRWGKALLPGAEAVRVAQEPSLAFAPAAFSRFEPANAGAPPRLREQFFGYLGPNGPLPIHLSDFIRERALNHGDRASLAFLDIFLHRFALHFYRAWAQARPVTAMDRPGEDGFRRQVGAFAGVGTPARQRRDEVRDDARLHFSGHLTRRVRNAESVESVLRAYFDVPARLEPWVGHWMRLPAAETTRLGGGRALAPRDAAARAMGRGAVLGRQVWDRQHRVRLHLGPLTFAQYRDFLPDGTAQPALQRWMQQLLGDELYWDACLILRKQETPPTRLGARTGNAPRLGWVSWLGHRARSRDAADVRIRG